MSHSQLTTNNQHILTLYLYTNYARSDLQRNELGISQKCKVKTVRDTY